MGAVTEPPSELVFGPLRIDTAARQVKVKGTAIRMTATEWEIFQCLFAQPGRVLSRAELLQRVFDTNHAGYARNVDCHVTRLRRKLEAAGLVASPVETVHGAGYRFVAPC